MLNIFGKEMIDRKFPGGIDPCEYGAANVWKG
jgi:hypothetical protein